MALAFLQGMARINAYKDLTVPSRYRFIFCDQLLRASISVPSNIAEGSRRRTA